MAKRAIWISFDLGVRGDYEGMYTFLDSHGAKECGGNVAYLAYEYQTDLVGELTKEIRDSVAIDRRSRIYLIVSSGEKGFRGRFLVGRRRTASWAGFGSVDIDEEDIG